MNIITKKLYLLKMRFRYGKNSNNYLRKEMFIETFDEIPLHDRGRFIK